MAPLRFQRLIEAATPDEQLTAFRRAVIQNDREANVYDLAESLLHWGDLRRQSWLYDYYLSSNPKPELEPLL
jgi:CRISPR type I-E-associated protein CasB/Cse2